MCWMSDQSGPRSMGCAFAWVLVFCVALGTAPGVARSDDFARGLQAYDGGDYAAAVAAWRRSAAAGHTDAMTAIANAYQQGQGVRADAEAAVYWYRRAAERGNAVAQMNLGDLASKGEGMQRDAVEAYVWLGLAAAQGNLWARQRQHQVAADLSPEEIAGADARIRDFKPSSPPTAE